MRTLEIDVRFEAGALRVKQATGVTDRTTMKDMRAMVRHLWRQPQYRELVRDLARPSTDKQHRKLFDVYTAYLNGKLGDLQQKPVDDRPLEALVDEWLGEFQASSSHKARYRQASACLLKQVRYKPKLSDLPGLLESYRMLCISNKTPRAFNYAKQFCMALTRDKAGKRHPVRIGIEDIPAMTEAKEGVLGMSAEEARAKRQLLLAAATVDNPNRDSLIEAARIWWETCCTGMGTTELWGSEEQTPEEAWKVLGDRVRIKGTKRPGRRWGSEGRDVPLVCTMTSPAISPDFYAKLLRKYAKAAPRQGRKTFACVMEDAEIPRTRRRMYLGHGAKDVTDRYEKREITAFLAEDRARLMKQFGGDTVLPMQVSPTLGLVPMAKEA